MTDSERPQPESTDAPVERPTWRFSGRRGTPVHLRERAPVTLPPEIRQAIAQMAREQSGERQSGETEAAAAAASTTPPAPRSAAKAAFRLDTEGRTPPVAGAPMPVERRSRRDAAADAVTMTPAAAVPGPALRPRAAEVESLAVTASVEPESEAAGEVDAPLVAATEGLEESRSMPEAEAIKEARPGAATPAKPKAKAPAKSRARKVKRDADGDAKRRLFAKGREVDPAEEAVAIEPIALEPFDVPVPAPDAEPSVEGAPSPTDAELQPAAELAPSKPVPLAEFLLETSEIFAPFEGPAPVPDPRGGLDPASQAAWELGRLPFLLPRDGAPAPAPGAQLIADIDELDIPRADPLHDAVLQPIDWREPGPAPTPAPITSDVPQRPVPAAIADLAKPLDVVRRDAADRLSSRAGTRVEHGRGSLDSADARRRVVQRRAQLDDLVAELSSLAHSAPATHD